MTIVNAGINERQHLRKGKLEAAHAHLQFSMVS